MSPPGVAIANLVIRVRAPDPETGFGAARLMDAAVGRLAAPLDVALPRVLAAAGLDEDAMLAIPRVALRLRIEGEAGIEELAAAWAEALATAVAAAVPQARHALKQPGGDAGTTAPTLFSNHWAAELALLRGASHRAAPPWWAAAAGADMTRHGAAAALLLGWIRRDPARAALCMASLLISAPDAALLITEREAALITAALLAALRAALPDGAGRLPPNWSVPRAGEGTQAGDLMPDPSRLGAAALLKLLPAELRGAVGALPPALRKPWIVAAVMAHAPGFVALLPGLLPTLEALPAQGWRASSGGPAASTARAEPTAGQATAAQATPTQTSETVASAEVLGGGLLLLLRPIATLAPAWLDLGAGLADRLSALGLLILQRLAAPLPHAARRAALERDRPLLTVFAGQAPPGGALDEMTVETAELQDILARLLAHLPSGIIHAPGALRRCYGRDPFAADAAGDALCRLVLRPGRLRRDGAMAEIIWPLEAADAALRRAGWDIDPGWLPWLGRRIGFRYEESRA